MTQNSSTNQHQSFYRSIAYSIGFHTFLFILIILFWGIGTPPPSPEMKVEWLRLGGSTGNEEAEPFIKTNQLPQSTLQEQKNARIEQPPLPKEKSKIQEKKPEGVEKPQVVVEDKSKKKIEKPKVIDNKPLEGRPAKADPRINQALAKINEDLKERTVLPEAAQVKNSGEGNPQGNPGGSNSECAAYSGRVKQRIIGNWIRMVSGQKPPRPPKIFVSINASGSVTSTSWLQKSGEVSLDGSAMRAVQNSSPFPSPPLNCQIALSGGITVQFGR